MLFYSLTKTFRNLYLCICARNATEIFFLRLVNIDTCTNQILVQQYCYNSYFLNVQMFSQRLKIALIYNNNDNYVTCSV